MTHAIENILRAYSIRNPTIGYCQGFNFIVGRLLKVVNEEVNVNLNICRKHFGCSVK